jgi:hypothetical protein
VVIRQTVQIAASPQRIFDVLVDPAAWFELDPTLVDVQPRDRLSIGATGTFRNRRGPGLVATAAWTTTELVPGQRVTQHLRGFGYELTEAVSLTANATGTEMSVVDTLWPTSLAGRLMVAFSRGIMERDLTTRFARLKALMQRPEPATAPMN